MSLLNFHDSVGKVQKILRFWRAFCHSPSDCTKVTLVLVDRVPFGTLDALRRQLRLSTYHVLHFIGHGEFDERMASGVLLLEDEQGRGRRVSGADLGIVLHNHPSLRLAILNACEGARTASHTPFAGVGQQLVQQGIPAVVALQFEITDKAAVTLAEEFYLALTDGYPVDAALAEARVAIFTKQNGVEWGTPVLYLRSPDGRLFQGLESSAKSRPNSNYTWATRQPADEHREQITKETEELVEVDRGIQHLSRNAEITQKLWSQRKELLEAARVRCGFRVEVALRCVRDMAAAKNVVAMAFGDNSFARDMVVQPEVLTKVTEIISNLVGFQVILDCQLGEKALPGMPIFTSQHKVLLSEVRNKCGFRVEAALKSVRDMAIYEQKVVMAFGENSFARDMVAQPEVLSKVKDIVSNLLGYEIIIECQLGEKAVRSP